MARFGLLPLLIVACVVVGAGGTHLVHSREREQSDVAEAAVFLASPASRFTTGQILAVDGGRLLLDPLEGAAI